ncbi:MAG: YceI family protein [Gemmatimonadetes bacterium]|nr:YceI family protein [Gemmatimonadota bacterium]
MSIRIMRAVTAATMALVAVLCPAPLTAQTGGDSTVYWLSPLSRLEVKTGKAGLFGFAGHEHVIRARVFSGRVVHYPSAPLSSHIEISIPTDSLEVLTPPDTAEIRKVTAAMRTEVLHVEQFRDITFVSKALTQTHGFRITGELTIVGQTRAVPVDVRVAIEADTLRAEATFAVNQTDFGIRPYRGGPAGLVRVANRVVFDIAVVAVAGPPQ